MTTALADFFRHHLWANLRLLDTCAEAPADLLQATAPGTYGSVSDTLVHILVAEEKFLYMLTGEQPEQSLRGVTAFPGFDALRTRARHSGEHFIAIAERADPSHILRGTWRGEDYALPMTMPLIQAINHATEHRVHIATILSTHGVPVPELDAWTYDEATS